ncbi:protein YpmT [uncultured Metabacillus sp.]|uniref:protein YpmT n=1 Tax=Metabacillus sp. Hm71 TaxID=3450743 RepID=UPI00262E45FF|nr:protein YpmT [uncultured Metabacillus sp.]
MKNKFVLFGMVAILISIIFGGFAYQQFVAENMDEVYLNIGYSTLFLSIAIYLWHMKDEKQKNNG